MLPVVLAAVLWQATTSLRVPNGETRTVELPPIAGAARLVFRVHADYWRAAGSNPLLRLTLNGHAVTLMRDRRTSRSREATAGLDGLARFDFGRWRVSQGRAAGARDALALDVSDLLRADGPNVLAFECAHPGRLGAMPLVIEDLRLEPTTAAPAPAVPPPDWTTPRLGLPAPPAFDVDADAAAVHVSWQGRRYDVRTAVIGGAHRLERSLERLPTHVVVRDTFTNTSAGPIGLRVRHAVATDATWVHLGGRTDPDIADAYSPWNPTVFTPVAGGGLGLVAEDDVFRQQLYVDFQAADDTVGMRTDMLCLGPGERETLVWSIYPVASDDYWDFLNTVRADWRVNRTVPGSFTWFTPERVLAMPAAELRAALARQGTTVAAMLGGWVDRQRPERPPHLGFGTDVLGSEFADYRRRIADAVAALKGARPGLCVLLYFDAQRESAPDATRRFADSLLRDLDGKPEQVDWGGQYSSAWGMVPTGDDAFGRALLGVLRAMRALGADGVYWDEMDGVDFREPRFTSSRWDGRSCVLADDGTVRAKIGLVNLLSEPVKLEYADQGMVLGNVPPTTRRFTDRADLRMVEAHHAESWAPFAHLTTPIGYVGIRRDWATVVQKIDEGLLVAGIGLDVPYDILARMFPLTPEYIQPGTLRGRERIVTTRSAIHGWRDCAGAVRAFRYDDAGHEHTASWRVKRRHGGAFVRVSLGMGEVAVIECDR
ncbi:MAG TPA: hypothetical protein VGK30_21375 [Candidatus Binatia bacterium]|jgi:hypothetical protein